MASWARTCPLPRRVSMRPRKQVQRHAILNQVYECQGDQPIFLAINGSSQQGEALIASAFVTIQDCSSPAAAHSGFGVACDGSLRVWRGAGGAACGGTARTTPNPGELP